MARISINGRELELLQGAEFQFVKKNILFAFENAECERTTQVAIPATKNNDEVLQFARDEHNTGGGMRVRYEAQLEQDGVVKHGQLYITEYDNSAKQYKGVFCTGELVGLLRLRQLGAIKDWYNPPTTARQIYGGTVQDPQLHGQDLWQNVYYKNTAAFIHPSWSLGGVIAGIAVQTNTPLSNVGTTLLQRTRVIVAEPKTPAELLVTFKTEVLDPDQPSAEPAGAYNSAVSNSDTHGAITSEGYIQEFTIHLLGRSLYTKLQFFTALYNMQLLMPEDWAADDFIIAAEADQPDISFLGGRYFDFTQSKTTHGEALAGRLVDVPRGTNFAFVKKSDYVNNGSDEGWRFNSIGRTLTIKVIGGDAEQGDTIWLKDNLPEVTFPDLLRVGAAVRGLLVGYDEASGVYYDALNASTYTLMDMQESLIKCSVLKRGFIDYAQHNVIRFESGEDVQEALAITIDYTIDNVNISQSKELQVIPFSEGALGTDGYLIVDDAQDGQKDDIIAYARGNIAMQPMQRVSLPKQANLQAALNAATELQVQVFMPLWQFEKMTARTAIYCRDVRWFWTEANWQKGVASIKLQKNV